MLRSIPSVRIEEAPESRVAARAEAPELRTNGALSYSDSVKLRSHGRSGTHPSGRHGRLLEETNPDE